MCTKIKMNGTLSTLFHHSQVRTVLSTLIWVWWCLTQEHSLIMTIHSRMMFSTNILSNAHLITFLIASMGQKLDGKNSVTQNSKCNNFWLWRSNQWALNNLKVRDLTQPKCQRKQKSNTSSSGITTKLTALFLKNKTTSITYFEIGIQLSSSLKMMRWPQISFLIKLWSLKDSLY